MRRYLRPLTFIISAALGARSKGSASLTLTPSSLAGICQPARKLNAFATGPGLLSKRMMRRATRPAMPTPSY